jgi:4-amino-4-deoxy-L-arabinose transferase-like glycosyltransferase
MSGAATKLFGSEHPLVVRLPFIAIFAATTFFAFAAGRFLFNARAGLYAALVLNLAPVIGWTTGSFVLPDGPLLAGMMLTTFALSRALFGPTDQAPIWWIASGIGAGIACLAKLHGIFLLAGTGLFLLTSATHRFWLLRPWPYVAALIGLLIFTPVIVWNIEHDWISFAFQSGRARATKFNPAGPFVALGGQALFILPWLWLPLLMAMARAVRTLPRDPQGWFLFCLAIGPIATFTLVALNGTHVLFHWAAPGYAIAALLLGRDIAETQAGLWGSRRLSTRWLQATAASLAIILVAVIALARLPWPTGVIAGLKVPTYPLIETVSWGDVRQALRDRGYAKEANLFVAAARWHEAARLDWALQKELPVYCLCLDPRGFGILHSNKSVLGQNAIIITAGSDVARTKSIMTPYFDQLEDLKPVTLERAGQPVTTLYLMRGTKLRDTGTRPNLIEPFVKTRS